MATRTMTPVRPGPINPVPLPTDPPVVPAPPAEDRVVSEDEIRVRAYAKWVAAGRPEGDGVNFWLEAEHELRQGR